MADKSENTGKNNSINHAYPWTKMNFLVTVDGIEGTTAFSEATGMEATVDVIEFRQGNSGSFSPVKVPGLVKHGNVTLKYGYTDSNAFRSWAIACTSDRRANAMPRHDVKIELLDVTAGIGTANFCKDNVAANQYLLHDAWISKYTAPDMNALQSEIAIETVEIAFERLELPGAGGTAAENPSA